MRAREQPLNNKMGKSGTTTQKDELLKIPQKQVEVEMEMEKNSKQTEPLQNTNSIVYQLNGSNQMTPTQKIKNECLADNVGKHGSLEVNTSVADSSIADNSHNQSLINLNVLKQCINETNNRCKRFEIEQNAIREQLQIDLNAKAEIIDHLKQELKHTSLQLLVFDEKEGLDNIHHPVSSTSKSDVKKEISDLLWQPNRNYLKMERIQQNNEYVSDSIDRHLVDENSINKNKFANTNIQFYHLNSECCRLKNLNNSLEIEHSNLKMANQILQNNLEMTNEHLKQVQSEHSKALKKLYDANVRLKNANIRLKRVRVRCTSESSPTKKKPRVEHITLHDSDTDPDYNNDSGDNASDGCSETLDGSTSVYDSNTEENAEDESDGSDNVSCSTQKNDR